MSNYIAYCVLFRLWVFGFAVLISSASLAQPVTLEAARNDIESTYKFDPSKMSFSQQAERAPNLSALWSRYDKTPGVYREALRSALASSTAPEMLYCDGGMLLLAKSKLSEDKALGLGAISKCTLSEIQHTPYFYTLHELAREGVDTFDLQIRLLSKPKYSVFIVQHALTLGQNYAFVYPLLLQDERRYVPRVAERLKTEKDATATKTLILVLWYAANHESERLLRAIADSGTYSEVARDEAKKMIKRIDSAKAAWFISPATSFHIFSTNVKISDGELEIREKRRARMRSISDEALLELDAYTPLLYRTLK